MHIRKVEKDDVENIQKLVLTLSNFYLKSKDDELPLWFSTALSTQAFLTRIESPDYKSYVYENEAGIVGYIAIKDNSYLQHLFVSEACHRQGICKLLWQYALQYLDSTISVRSSVYAIPVYKKLGFIESGSLAEKDGILFLPMEFRRPQ